MLEVWKNETWQAAPQRAEISLYFKFFLLFPIQGQVVPDISCFQANIHAGSFFRHRRHPAEDGKLNQKPRKFFSTYYSAALKTHQEKKQMMKLSTFGIALTSFAVASLLSQAATPAPATTAVNCTPVAKTTASLVAKNKSKVLEIVSSQVAANSACACEIVKTAIKTSKAEKATVAAIVEAAIVAAPDQIRIIAQCAIAAAPDAAAEIMAVVQRLSPGGNSAYSSKSSKSPSAKGVPPVDVASVPNVLDFPGFGPIGPIPGSPGGGWEIPIFPPLPPQPVTSVDP